MSYGNKQLISCPSFVWYNDDIRHTNIHVDGLNDSSCTDDTAVVQSTTHETTLEETNNNSTKNNNNDDDEHHRSRPIELYLVIANIAKHNNVRSLLLTAAAFCQSVILVGMKKFDIERDLPGPLRYCDADDELCDQIDHSKGEQPLQSPPPHQQQQQSSRQKQHQEQRRKLNIIRLDRWEDCVLYLQECHIRLVGVEIQEQSILLEEFCSQLRLQQQQPSNGSPPLLPPRDMALVMGNEGQGLSRLQMDSCETLVRIPQYGNGTASLNVYVAASIILQQCHQILRQNRQQRQQQQQQEHDKDDDNEDDEDKSQHQG